MGGRYELDFFGEGGLRVFLVVGFLGLALGLMV